MDYVQAWMLWPNGLGADMDAVAKWKVLFNHDEITMSQNPQQNGP